MSLIKLGWRQYFLRNILQRNMFILHMLIILHIPIFLNHNIYIHIMSTCYTYQACSYPTNSSAFINVRVYSCTYCDRKGHLAKFYFDRINASNDHIWVRKTNTLGPQKFGYQNQQIYFLI